LHEPADKLSEQAQRLRQEWQSMRRPEFSGPGAPSGPGPDAIRAELEELRQAIRELRARVEDLNRQRP
jgi:50S ribosomal subunit-associated GTPase HflX